MRLVLPCAVLAALPSAPGAFAGSNWSGFRGSDATGVSAETDLPDRWSTTENVAWSVAVPGRGWSSPIVWGTKVFVTSAINEGEDNEIRRGLYPGRSHRVPHVHRWVVRCLDFRSGNTLWEREVHRAQPETSVHIKNTYASETPVADGERVYAYFGNIGLFACDMSGKIIWERRWKSVRTRWGWGTAASPVLHGDRVYIVNDNEDQSFLAALDARTGAEVWKMDRDERSNWSTPFIWKNDVRTEIVTPGSDKVRSYDLEGKLLWQLQGMSKITISTPYAAHGLLYISSGYVLDSYRPIYAIRPGAAGDISIGRDQTSGEHIAWHRPKAAPYNPSTIVYGDHLYTLLDRGFLTCHDARSGEEIYGRQRLGRGASGFTASPWAYEGQIFCLSEDGDTFVVKAGREFEVLRKNSLEELCMATPAVSRGSLFVRTLTKLYRIRRPREREAAGSR